MTIRREMVENCADKQRIEYVEIYKIIITKARENISKYNQEIVRETVMASKSLRKVRRTQMLGQDRLIAFLDNQGREIHDQDKIIERIKEFYTELYDSEQSNIIHTDPNEVPYITPWEVEAALRDMKNGTATGKLAKLYKKLLSERVEEREDGDNLQEGEIGNTSRNTEQYV